MSMMCRETYLALVLPRQTKQAPRQFLKILLLAIALLVSWLSLLGQASAREQLASRVVSKQTSHKVAAPLMPQSPSTAQANTFGLKPLSQLSVNIAVPKSTADLPADVAASHFERENRLAYAIGVGRYWPLTNYHWDASQLYHEPLLFEELNVERYGITYGCLQPIVSGAHFFITVPALPYKTWAQGNDCKQYSLGYYRPGSYAVPQRYMRPLRADAGLFQAGVILGMIYILP